MTRKSIINTNTQDEFITACSFEKLSKSSLDLVEKYNQEQVLSLFKIL
jgi:hypothetical protein